MRKSMASEIENYIKSAKSNKEIRKLCSNNENLLEGLKENLNEPKHLIEGILQKCSLKGKLFEVYEPATSPKIKQHEDALVENYDENILLLSSTIEVFREPVPTVNENNTTHYVHTSEPKEQYMPSKSEDPSKQNHDMPFPLTAQTPSHVGVLITCLQCHKFHLIYSKHNLSGNQITSLKRLLNNFRYVCGTIFHDIPLDDPHPDTRVAEHVFNRVNISCKSNIEIPYYTLRSYKKICIRCRRWNGLLPANPEFNTQCSRCNATDVSLPQK